MKAVSIRQPWAWLILNAGKDVENRTWSTPHRGPLVIHASKTPDPGIDEIRQILADEFDILIPPTAELPFGGIVGLVDVVDCFAVPEEESPDDSPWLAGPYGWQLANPRPLPFRPLRGRQKLFEVEL